MTTATRPQRLVPTEAIAAIDRPIAKVQRFAADLKMEADEIANEWEGLSAIGAGREDHAAALLGRLIIHFGELAKFSLTVKEQLERMARDPFGREE